ncbi:cystathionine gamma-synthase [Jeotgalicoccus coquinae]|uniref:homocysteine desulfhydrase n=1 Tax=Jeotgalicoccus coquinae TaxID=709509 RepID=A0A6V7R1R4_9STAP|nr:PLP-dependent aspartate aminotransferase family protein [Jeotgalicoccus coquinae]MBB6423622.1 cystathionine gamma-synthase [Jeotgalicoccus coquinae]GGE21296.1 cystathionine gamma-synthase [Jeotgalicoccus coquinae]CAD2071279.1 Cystathionine gamma-synthase [Jeotgalicoccus coquinae]
MRFETKAIHAGRQVDPVTGAVTTPLHLSTTYERSADGSYTDGFMYSRGDNPNRRSLEECLTALEEGYDSVTFASGMAAISAVIESLPQDMPQRIILPDDMYFGVLTLLNETDIGRRFDIVTADMSNIEDLKAAVKSEPTGLIWIETPSNPQIKIIDIAAVVSIAKEAGAVTVVDNTTATPVLQNPLSLGADFSLHSVTKYIGGHSDLLLGAVVAKEDSPMLQNLRTWQHAKGAVPSSFDCWLALRGVQTLSARMSVHCSGAKIIADFLNQHDKVEAVYYPGLLKHPGHDIAASQMSDFGGLMSFKVKGKAEAALKVANTVKIFTQATSLGGTHSYIEHRASVEKELTKAPDTLLRLSVGLENVQDLQEDLAQALSGI